MENYISLHRSTSPMAVPDHNRTIGIYTRMFEEPLRIALKRVLDSYVGKDDRVLEIGSGAGDLVALLPEYRGRIQQTVRDREMAARNRGHDPGSNVKVANPLYLPYLDGEFCHAVAYNSLTAIDDLKGALQEIMRVLSPGGKVIHFLDRQASPFPLLREYKGLGYVAFPSLEADGRIREARILEEGRTGLVPGTLYRRMERLFDSYTRDPVSMYWVLTRAENAEVLWAFATACDSLWPDAPKVGFDEFFYRRLDAAIAPYTLIRFGNEQGTSSIPLSEGLAADKGMNVYVSKAGDLEMRCNLALAKRIGPDSAKVVIDVSVAVVGKP